MILHVLLVVETMNSDWWILIRLVSKSNVVGWVNN